MSAQGTMAEERRGAGAAEAHLLVAPGVRRPRGVALLAHGGRARGVEPAGALAPTALRMYPFLLALGSGGARHGLAVAQLRYRVRGWNGGDPVEDVEWALERLAERFPDAPVCLVGHSMGGRAALRAAGAPSVEAVAALAPWVPPGEPLAQLAGRTVMVVHGERDRITDPAASERYAREARARGVRVCRFSVARSGHAMLGRAHVWHELVRGFTLAALGLAPWPARIESAFDQRGEAALRVRV